MPTIFKIRDAIIQALTTFALIFDRGNSSLLPPINGSRNVGFILMRENSGETLAPPHPVVFDARAGVFALELLVGHVCKLVETERVWLSLLVEVIDEPHILLEHIESFVVLDDANAVHGHTILALPPPIQIPEALLRLQVLLLKALHAVGHSKQQCKCNRKKENSLHDGS